MVKQMLGLRTIKVDSVKFSPFQLALECMKKLRFNTCDTWILHASGTRDNIHCCEKVMDILAKWITLDEISISKNGRGGREMKVEFHKSPEWKDKFDDFKAKIQQRRKINKKLNSMRPGSQ